MGKKYTNSVECRLNKKIYPTKAKAEAARKRQSLYLNRSLRVYYCHNCMGYHLTKSGGIPVDKPIMYFDLSTGKVHTKDKE
jgi:hypothetical protein